MKTSRTQPKQPHSFQRVFPIIPYHHSTTQRELFRNSTAEALISNDSTHSNIKPKTQENPQEQQQTYTYSYTIT